MKDVKQFTKKVLGLKRKGNLKGSDIDVLYALLLYLDFEEYKYLDNTAVSCASNISTTQISKSLKKFKELGIVLVNPDKFYKLNAFIQVADENKLLLAKDYKDSVKDGISKIVKLYEATFDMKPKLVCIQVGNRPDSNLYINMKRKAFEELGIEFEVAKPKGYEEMSSVDRVQFMKNVINHFKQNNVQGIMIQLPIPGFLIEETEEILNYIPKELDVDGLSCYNRCFISDRYMSKNIYVPCTARGIMSLLKYNNITLAGKNVAVIGRSVEVGKPLVDLLIKENATVTCIHTFTPMNCRIDILQKSDIVISAAGCARHIKPEYLKNGVVIVDAGVTVIDGKSVGDFDEACYEKASKYTPYVGAVGPMTITSLLENFSESCIREVNDEYDNDDVIQGRYYRMVPTVR